jgi:hypothetical protein
MGIGVGVPSSADVTSATVGNLLAIVLLGCLGWGIWKEQKVWASVVLLVWAIVDTAIKAAFMLGPNARIHANASSFVINFIVLAAAIMSVRGCLELSRLRRIRY